jgi:hypothetical protein
MTKSFLFFKTIDLECAITQRQGKIEITHTKMTRGRGTKKNPTEHRGDTKTEALTDFSCSRGVKYVFTKHNFFYVSL